MSKLISTFLKRSTLMATSFILAISSLSVAMPLFLSNTANAITPIVISTVPELCNAIDNQADGQIWSIQSGQYGLGQCNSILTQGQTGWYMPITKNNITINGVGNPTIYGTGFTANGAWATQDLIAIFGNDVTINGLTLMPKVEPNKTIEVMGANATIENVTITPNTLTPQSEYDYISDPTWKQEAKTWGGSIYYNNATGTQTLSNVTINNGGVSVHSPGTTFNVNSLNLAYTSNVDWLNDYRFYLASPTSIINGTPTYTYHVNSTLNNFDSVLAAVGDLTTVAGTDTISLDSNLTTAKQITLAKPVTLNGNGNTISAGFNYTSNSNNSVIGITGVTGVTINNLKTDGTGTTGLYGINVYKSTGVNLNDVTVKNNSKNGLGVNGSYVTVDSLTTMNNAWGGVDVDLGDGVSGITNPARLTVNGVSHHTEAGADLFIDDSTKAVSVVDTSSQYDIISLGYARVYKLKMAAPTNLRWLNHIGDTLGAFTNVNQVTPAWTAPVTGVVDHYEYSYTSPTNASWSAPSSFTGTSIPDQAFGGAGNNGVEGPWQFKVRSVGQFGNVSLWVQSPIITYDKTIPAKPTLSSPSNNAVVNGTSLTQSWADTSSDVDHYIYESYTNSTATNLRWHQEVSGTSKTATNVANTTYWWRVKAVDHAGNFSSWSNLWKITVDNDAPIVDITGPLDGANVRGTVVISGTVTDAHPDHYYLVVKNSSNSVVGGPHTVNSATVSDFNWDTTTVSDGTYTIDLEARDAANNKDAGSVKTISVVVDNHAPVVTIPTYSTNGNVITPTATATDANSPLTYTWTADNAASGTNVSISDNSALEPDFTVNLDGTYSFTLTATDPAGNGGTQTFTFSYVTPTAISAPVVNTPVSNTPTTGNGFTNVTATPGAVLGDATTTPNDTTTTDKTATPSVLGTSTDKTATSTPWGIAWYWWLLIIAAVVALFWAIIAAMRRRQAES